MDLIKNEDKKESLITLEDFPFICRICCLRRNDLRLFEEEDYLFDLFHTIRKIDAFSRATFPRNICNGCVNNLEDLSMFIDISRYSDGNIEKNVPPKTEIIEIESRMSRESLKIIEEIWDPMIFQESRLCRFCSSPSSSLTSFGEESHLMQVFQKITDIDLKAAFHNSKIITICRKCNKDLEKISAFISSSLCNDQKLENAIGTSVKTENHFDPIDTAYGTMTFDYELATSVEQNYLKNSPERKLFKEGPFEDTFDDKSFPLESKEKLEVIDVKEEIIDSKLAISTDQNYPKTSPERKLLEEVPFEEAFVKEVHLSSPLNKLDIKVDLGTRNGEKPFNSNSNCSKNRFSRKLNLPKHSGKKLYKCGLCNKRSARLWNMQKHLLTHTTGKKLKCDRCEKTFIKKWSLLRHLLIHMGIKPFKCDLCGKRLGSKYTMEQHKIIHSAVKPFKCELCNKRFNQKYTLRKHMRTHEGEKPFNCRRCKVGFEENRDWQAHLLSHGNEKRFNCNNCPEQFSNRSSWRRHMLLHSRNNPFKCHSCHGLFKDEHQLQQHLLFHAEENLFRCKCCNKSFLLEQSLHRHYARSHIFPSEPLVID